MSNPGPQTTDRASGDARLPDVAYPAIEVATVTTWDAAGEVEQRTVAGAVMDRWEAGPRPNGLHSVTCFTSADPVSDAGVLRGTAAGSATGRGLPDAVVAYAQWTTGPASPGPTPYRLYRSYFTGRSATPGCVVFVTIHFDGPDRPRLERWVDGILAALASEAEPAPGLVAAHFHTSLDGTRVLNYAEWTSAQAHRDALGGNGRIGQTDTPEWKRARELPGVIRNTVGRYHLHRAFR